jgi:hypothetical protein
LAIYLIATELKNYEAEYESLEFEIKVLAHDGLYIARPELVTKEPKFIRVIESVWLLKSKLSANEITYNLKEAVPSLANFIVIKVSDNYQGDLYNNVWHWLEKFHEDLI